MEKLLHRFISALGTGGALANVAASLEDSRTNLAAVDEACRRLATEARQPAAA